MLTPKMIEVLDRLINWPGQGPNGFSLDSKELMSDNVTHREAYAIIERLAEENFITVKRYVHGLFMVKLTLKGLDYKSFEQNATPQNLVPQGQTNVFNGPVNNAAITNSGNVTNNFGITFEEALQAIQSQAIPSSDKESATEVINTIKDLTESGSSMGKGFLSKFSDIIAKHHWFPELISKLLFTYFTGSI